MVARTLADLVALAELKDSCAAALACSESALRRTESSRGPLPVRLPRIGPTWVRTVLYDPGWTSLRSIERDPYEEDLLALRSACTPQHSQIGREHVE